MNFPCMNFMCPSNTKLDRFGDCICVNSGFQKAPGRTEARDSCYRSCPVNYNMQSDGSCKMRELVCPTGTVYAYTPTGRQCIQETVENINIAAQMGWITG